MISDPLSLISDEKLRKYLHRGPWQINVRLVKTSNPSKVGTAVTGMPASVVEPPLRHQGQHESTVKSRSDSTKRLRFSRKEENLVNRNFTNSLKSELSKRMPVLITSLRSAGTLVLYSGERDIIDRWPIYSVTYQSNLTPSNSCEVREFIIYFSSSVDEKVMKFHSYLKHSCYKDLCILVTDKQQFYYFIQ